MSHSSRAVCVGLVLLMTSLTLAAQTAPRQIRGDVVRLDGQKLEVKTNTGEMVSVTIADKARIFTRAEGDRSQIGSGAFVGVTAVPQPDGTLLASEVQVFPEAMRGV